MKYSLILLISIGSHLAVLSQQKNRISLGYHFGYIIERNDVSKLGLQANVERTLTPNWSINLGWAIEDYCRCDIEPYAFYRRRAASYINNLDNSSSNPTQPGFSRFFSWSMIGTYGWKLNHTNRSLRIGTGLTWRSGFETFVQFRSSFETIYDSRKSADWGIPFQLAYRYDPPRQWWGLTGYLLYHGYFHVARDYLGHNPVHVLQAGLNFDIRFGKREELKRE